MRRGRNVRLAAVLAALLVALAGLPAAAAGPPDRTPGRARSGVAALWAWLTAKLPVQIVLPACDQSSHIDPNGRCFAGATATNGPPPATPDESWHIDPNG